MLYLANPCTPRVRDAMRNPVNNLGMIATPAQGNPLMLGVPWCADNGVFGGAYPGDQEFLDWLAHWPLWAAHTCRFVVAPDVVGDAAGTLERSAPMLPRIRSYGVPVALAAQNGLEDLTVPWDAFDVLFIGGDTEWKLGPAARALVAEARARGKRVHMGRVNSEERLRYAADIGCDTADGTYLAFGPDTNLPKLLGWLRRVNHPTLWEAS